MYINIYIWVIICQLWAGQNITQHRPHNARFWQQLAEIKRLFNVTRRLDCERSTRQSNHLEIRDNSVALRKGRANALTVKVNETDVEYGWQNVNRHVSLQVTFSFVDTHAQSLRDMPCRCAVGPRRFVWQDNFCFTLCIAETSKKTGSGPDCEGQTEK